MNARWLAILPTGSTLAIMIGWSERETAYAGWLRHWIHWGGWRAVDDHTLGNIMDMPFVSSLEKVHYERRLACLLPKIQSDEFSSTAADLDL